MRVAYLINQYPKVSHSFIRREILALEHLGHEVLRIALRGWDGDLPDPDDQMERKRTCYVLRAGAFKLLLAVTRMAVTRPVRFMRSFALACRMGWKADRPLPVHLIYLVEACLIESWLRAADISHLHAHFGTNSAEIAMLVHLLGGPSWSFTVHGPEEFDKTRLIGLSDKIKRASFVIAVSSYGRSQLFRLVEQKHWPKIHVVHCGLDRAFYDLDEGPPPAAQRFVCVGRLCEQKGQLLLLEAARRLAEAGVDFELVLAGDGELRQEIESLITRYKLRDRVRITGWISNQQVRTEILGARALVLPSFAEGLPVVIMEAMALGRPVVSTYVAGIPELVAADENGWLVPAGDVETLALTMRACLQMSRESLAQMASKAQQSARAWGNVDIEAKKLANLFKSAGGTHF